MGEMQDAVVRTRVQLEPRDIERVYREDGPRLQRAVCLFTGDRDVADDAVAEAFAQALQRGEEIRDPLRWVWRVAFRVAAGAMKDRRRSIGPLDSMSERSYEQSELPLEFMAALAKLSPKQRGAVILFHLGGYPTREVARILGSTAPAVTVHLSVGRKRLRELLEEHDD